jgi:uncharacterized protein involved in exopolysaccharide biosynthesis
MAAPAADLEAEREIDLSRWREALAARWWIVAACVAGGIVLGAVYSLSGGSVQQASVLIAPGQPFTQSGNPVLPYISSPRAINEIVTSASATQRAAARANMPVSELRGNVHTETVSTGSGTAASRGSLLVRVTVSGQKPKRVEDAANALGLIVQRDTTDRFVQAKIAALEANLESINQRLTSVQALIDSYTAALENENLAPLDKLVLVNQLDAAISRQGNLNDRSFAAEQALALSRTVERAQIITAAVAEKTTARSRRNSILVGALIGLVVGVIAALVVDWRASRAQPA